MSRFIKCFWPAILAICITLLSGCVSQRNVELLQDKEELKVLDEPVMADYTLKPNDELYIQIKSLDDPTTNMFQQAGGLQSSTASLTPYSASMTSYLIDKEGKGSGLYVYK